LLAEDSAQLRKAATEEIQKQESVTDSKTETKKILNYQRELL
jgi:hypothetical protein